MESLATPHLSWPYYYHGKSMEDLRQSMMYTLETTRMAAQQEMIKREEQLSHLQELLNKAVKERDEAQEKCKKLLIEKLLIQQHHHQLHQKQEQQLHLTATIAEDPIVRKDLFCSPDYEDSSIVSSPNGVTELVLSSSPRPQPVLPDNALKLLSSKKPLPEKGKLLQAVIKAGPLLQTLLLAGPLPQWKHPPPPLDTLEIPPVQIPSSSSNAVHHNHLSDIVQYEGSLISGANCGAAVISRKRSFLDGVSCGSSGGEVNKYQKGSSSLVTFY